MENSTQALPTTFGQFAPSDALAQATIALPTAQASENPLAIREGAEAIGNGFRDQATKSGCGCCVRSQRKEMVNPPSSYDSLLALDIRVATVIAAEPNPKSRKPMLILTCDFGNGDIKRTSAMITQNYDAENVIGLQIAAATNLPLKLIAGFKSEFLLLAATAPGGSVLLTPKNVVPNGTKVA